MDVFAVVIPARNEAARLGGVVRMALGLPADLIVPVLNGCDDMSEEILRRMVTARLRPLTYPEPLGFDVPRIAGAQAALAAGARAVLFLDGDLEGPLLGRLLLLAEPVRQGKVDLALADCYQDTPVPSRRSLAREVYRARLALNQALGRPDLGAAIPSHGPCVVSRRLLQQVPLHTVGVPPLMQAHACRAGMRVAVVTPIPHKELGSARREEAHRVKVAETIIGDCLDGICLAQGRPPDRQGHIGYHRDRRFDLVGLAPPGDGGGQTHPVTAWQEGSDGEQPGGGAGASRDGGPAGVHGGGSVQSTGLSEGRGGH
jgi:hypothetical protein